MTISKQISWVIFCQPIQKIEEAFYGSLRMLTPETNYLVAIERHKDHIRNFERINWWQLEKPETRYQTWNRKVCCWLGRLLRHWGTRLEQYGTPAAPPKVQHT